MFSICSQVNDMMIKISELLLKLTVAHYGAYNASLVIGLSCWFFHFLGNRASPMLFAIWNMNSRDWLLLSTLCTTLEVYVFEWSFAHPYILWESELRKSFGLCLFPLLQRRADRKCLLRWRRFFKETELWLCSVMSSSGELLTSFLGPMKHHFEYRELFQDDLLHQNNMRKWRNIFWLPLLYGPMCAPIPHVPLLSTQENKYAGVNMYYLFSKLRVRSETQICSFFHNCNERISII